MTAGPITVAAVQFAPGDDAEANRARIAGHVAEATARGAGLVVLPEYSSYFVNPFDGRLRAHAETLDGPFVESLIATAAQFDVAIVAGLLEAGGDDSRVRNTVVAVDGGGILAVYRKQHLYDAFGQRESDWVEPGPLADATVFDLDGIRFGLMTCYDLRFPEMGRVLADAGADAFLVPAEWVRGPLKEDHWRTLLRARAIENTVFVVGADHPAPIAVGRSAIVDPRGIELAALGDDEGIAVAPLDRTLLDRVRRINPVLELRRYRVEPHR